MCTVFFLISVCLSIDNVRYRVDKNELTSLLIIDVRHSKISLVGSSSLIFEVILKLPPRESFKEPFQFEGYYVVIVAQSYHQLHMVPVADAQKKVIVHVFALAIIKRIVDIYCEYPERSWVTKLMR